MAIKNAYSKIKINNLFSNLQKTLVTHGAKQILFDYDNDGKVKAIAFKVDFKGKSLPIQLPANIDKVRIVLDNQGFYKVDAYRVGWKNINDWIEAQLALIETEQATLPQVFLPYIVDGSGKTLYSQFENGQLALE